MSAARKATRTSEEEQLLLKEGWRSTGDVPFILAHQLNMKGSSLSNNMPGMLKALIKDDTKKYREANVRYFEKSRKTYVSPVVIERLRAVAKARKKK